MLTFHDNFNAAVLIMDDILPYHRFSEHGMVPPMGSPTWRTYAAPQDANTLKFYSKSRELIHIMLGQFIFSFILSAMYSQALRK